MLLVDHQQTRDRNIGVFFSKFIHQ